MQCNLKRYRFFTIAFLGTLLISQQSVAQKEIIPFYADENLALDWVSGDEQFKEKGDHVWFSFMIQARNMKENTVEVVKLSVSVNECVKGSGRLKIFDTKNKFIEESDFIIGGASVGSAIAKFACEVAIDSAKEAVNSKSK